MTQSPKNEDAPLGASDSAFATNGTVSGARSTAGVLSKDASATSDAALGTGDIAHAPARWWNKIWHAIKTVVTRIGADRVTDLAATMTYYMLLSVFPLLVAVVSLLNIFGLAEQLVPALEESIKAIASDEVSEYVAQMIGGFLTSDGASVALILGLVVAVWSASRYIGAFIRSLNSVFQVSEKRSFFRLRAIQFALTGGLITGIIVVLAAFTMSDTLLGWLGDNVGLGQTFISAWQAVRTPVLVAVVCLMLAGMFYLAPSLKRHWRSLLSPGAVVAILLAIVAGSAFNAYLDIFNGASSYAKTYGALGGVVVILMLMWLLNVSFLLGAELDSWLYHRHDHGALAYQDDEPEVLITDQDMSEQPNSNLIAPSSDDAVLEERTVTSN